jgi:cytochrome P450
MARQGCGWNFAARACAAGANASDWVAECGRLLPMHNFNDMMGVPDGIRQKTSHEMSVFMSWGDPEVTGSTTEEKLGRMREALTFMHELAQQMVDERRKTRPNR